EHATHESAAATAAIAAATISGHAAASWPSTAVTSAGSHSRKTSDHCKDDPNHGENDDARTNPCCPIESTGVRGFATASTGRNRRCLSPTTLCKISIQGIPDEP